MTTLYHRTLPPRIVATEDDVRQLLEQGWADTPAAFYEAAPAPADTPEDTRPSASRLRQRKA